MIRRQERKVVSSLEKQVGGGHYKNYAIQPIEFVVKNNIPFREACAIKYAVRHADKNGAEDIRKAIHYLEMILEDYEKFTFDIHTDSDDGVCDGCEPDNSESSPVLSYHWLGSEGKN